jgi:hypothetical protein
MILEGEDALRFHQYLERGPTEEELRSSREIFKLLYAIESRENTTTFEI